MPEAFVAFYLKYRSQTFSDLIGEDHIRNTLLEAVKSDKLSHAYLLCGPRGTGKTSTARLLAKIFTCQTILADREAKKEISGEPCNKCESCLEINAGRAMDVIEIDAASHTKVDEIREVIDKVQLVPTKAKKKVYIIDEVHMLSNSSFNALLKTLEEPPKHAVFILATTEVHKLPATILSRTQRYDFRRVTKEDIVKNLQKIADLEGIEIDKEAIDLIALSAEGGHRDAISLLEQVSSVSKKIDKRIVSEILGIAESKEVYGIVGAIFNANPEEGLKIAHRLYANGLSMSQFCKEIVEVLRKILLFKVARRHLLEDTQENLLQIESMSNKVSEEQCLNAIQIFVKSGQLLKDVSYPLLPIEMAVVENCTQFSTTNPKLEARNPKRTSLSEGEVQNTKNPKDESERAVIPAEVGDARRGAGIQKCAVLDPRVKPENDNVVVLDDKVTDRDDNDKNNLTMKQFNNEKEDGVIKKTNINKPASEEKETVSIAVFQMTDDLWQRAIDEVKKENSTLAALLRDAKPLEVTGNTIKLGVRFPFHKEKISEQKNCAYLEKVVSDIMGQKCILTCEITKPKKKTGEGEDLVRAAEEIFS